MERASRGAIVIAAVVATALIASVTVRADAEPGAEALGKLKAGNARFVSDASEALPITAPRRTALAQGQSPFATVLSCADSRVPPEVIFHTGLGDLFVVRSAGHVADRSVLASLEYGAEHLHTRLLVVMGHESCGAVKATIDTPPGTSLGPNLDYLLKSIRPAVARTAGQPADIRLRAAILANVEETINQLFDTSTLLKHLAETQQLSVVGGYYELATGRVHFSEPVHVLPRPANTTMRTPPGHGPTTSPAAPAKAPSTTSATATTPPAAAPKPAAATATAAPKPVAAPAAPPVANAAAKPAAASATSSSSMAPGATAVKPTSTARAPAAPAASAPTAAAHAPAH